MEKNIMLGCWGLGRKTVVSDPPLENLDMQEFISQVGGGFNWKIMSSIERELETSSQQSSFAVSPLSRSSMGHLDIVPFVLYDKVIMDRTSYKWLVNEGEKLPITQAWASEESIAILDALRNEGILVLVDYPQIVDKPEQASILRAMMHIDINDPWMRRAWLSSINSWIDYLESGKGMSEEQDNYLQTIISKLQIILDRTNRGVVANPGEMWYWMYLADCISDVNCALLVSRALETPVLDWDDYQPFYYYKFFRAQKQDDTQKNTETLKKLFDVFIPQFSIRHVDELLSLRQDKRLEAVRELSRTTQPEDISDDLVRQAISDVLKLKENVQGFSKVVSILTIPLGFIPIFGDPLQIVVEEVSEKFYKNYLEKEFSWQCFFVDLYKTYPPSVLQDRLDCARPM